MIILTLLPQSLHPITNKTILRTENSTFSKPSLPYSNYTNAYLGYSPFPVWGLSTQPKQRSKDSTVFGTTLIHGAALNGGTRKSTREAIGNQNHNQSCPISSYAIWLIAIFCSRDDKRYTEKKNKSERARRKKEDTAKLRGLVDLTLRYKFPPCFSPNIALHLHPIHSLDPRIKLLKQQEKEAREAKKNSGVNNGASAKKTKAQLEEEKKRAEEEEKQKEEEEKVCSAFRWFLLQLANLF
jgi:hypothetical protein